MRNTIALACAAIIGVTALAERAEALVVSDAYSFIELRRNANGSVFERYATFIDVSDVDGDITSARFTAERTPDSISSIFRIEGSLSDFGRFQGFGDPNPVRNLGEIFFGGDDPTILAQSIFTIEVSDSSETVTAEIGPKLNPNQRATFTPLVSDVTTSGSSLAPTVSWTNPTDMTDVDQIRVRFLQSGVNVFSEIYEIIITDLATESITVPEGFLFAGDYELRVQLEDTESIDRVLDGVPVTRESIFSRSTHVSDFTAVQLPLPGTVSLLLAGLAAFGWLGRKRPLGRR